MPRNDFQCTHCGQGGTYWATRATAPICCGERMEWAPQPGSYAIDAREPFHKFEVECGGTMRRVESLNDMRKIERESEARSRSGDGQPMVWRDWSQDKSNFDSHTLAKHTDRPVTGYAEGTTGVDGKRFRKRVGDSVTRDHGTV